MRKEIKLPTLAKVFGVTAVGLAMACGGERVVNNGEVAGQPDNLQNTPVDSIVLPTPNVEEEQILVGPNLFPDPSFESGDWRNNWVIAGKIITQGGYEETPNYLSIDNTEAHSGSSSLRMTFLHDLEDEYSHPPACERQPGYGFTFNSEIQLPAGFYEIGVWLKASPRIDEAWFSVGGWLAKDNSFGLGTWGADSTNGRTNWPSEWGRLAAVFQVTEEIAQPFFQPSFNVEFWPARLPCGSQIDIWFDDVFLHPVTPQPRQEVDVLKLPDYQLWQMLREKSQPLVERALALKSKISNPADARNVSPIKLPALESFEKENQVRDYLIVVAVLRVEYKNRRERDPAGANEFLSLAKDVCKFTKENLPEEFAKSLQDPTYDELCIFQE